MTPATIRTIRQSLGLTAEGLAQALGYKPRAVYAWELGERPVPALVAAVVEMAMNGTLDLPHLVSVVSRH